MRLIEKPGASISTKNMVAPRSRPPASSVRAITMLIAAPGAPVISHLRPLMTKSSPTAPRGGFHQHRIGAGAAVRLGHREDGADFAAHQRSKPALLLRRRRDLVEQVGVALVGRLNVERERSQRRPSGGFEDDRHAAMVEAQPAPFARPMGREQFGLRAPSGPSRGAIPLPGHAGPAADRARAERSRR